MKAVNKCDMKKPKTESYWTLNQLPNCIVDYESQTDTKHSENQPECRQQIVGTVYVAVECNLLQSTEMYHISIN